MVTAPLTDAIAGGGDTGGSTGGDTGGTTGTPLDVALDPLVGATAGTPLEAVAPASSDGDLLTTLTSSISTLADTLSLPTDNLPL